jgi:hypothetical protein
MDKTLPIVVLALFTAGGARAANDPTAELNAERDQLIEKIRDGVDYDASVKRFGELLGKRDVAVATTEAARAKERERANAERAERDARHKLKQDYEHTVDWEVAWRCTLPADPAHPPPSTEGRFKADWGKVTRKEQIRLPPKNELDEGEAWTLYEVSGLARAYSVHGERSGVDRARPFTAELGDLVLVCVGGESMDGRMPKSWGMRVMSSGFALRLQRPPKIAQKARWNPIHVTGSALFWAVKDVKWKYPPGAFILFNLEIGEDLGGGRFRIALERDMSWILEVPPRVKRPQVPLAPGQHVWAILGNPRFDKTEKTLVLTAEDLEERYIDEK